MKHGIVGVCCYVGSLISVFALTPNDVAVIINTASPDSLELANYYMAIRDIPAQNMIYITISPDVEEEYMTSEQFLNEVWNPVQEIVRSRGIADNILAWLYSAGFPHKVDAGGMPYMSLQGITLTGGVIPEGDMLPKGLYKSPYYRGPDPNANGLLPSLTFDRFSRDKGRFPGMPSMMLGHTGVRGNPMAVAINVLRKGALADGTKPRGTIYFVTSDDVRSTCRQWQFEPASRLLSAANVRSSISSNYPANATSVMGVMAGSIYVNPYQMGTFPPGSVADHLTSFAGNFFRDEHTKITTWLQAGVTASAGSVSEPYALWTKFPNAFFYVHYVNGCSIIESFYQSIRCPLQLLLIGEPLAKPWAQNMLLTLVCLNEGPITDKATFYVDIMGAPKGPRMISYYLDGHKVESAMANPLEVDTTRLSDGYHELRAVTRLGTNVSVQAVAKTGFEVRNHGRSVAVQYNGDKSEVSCEQVIEVLVDATGEHIKKMQLYCNGRVVGSHVDGNVYHLDPHTVGVGPVLLQAGAVYADGSTVMSVPVKLTMVD